jgi:hypothetical protein
MKHLFIALALFISPSIFAQTLQTRSVADFNGITSASGIKVEITQGNENVVTVSSSDDALVDKIKTEVDKNGVLKIYYEYQKGVWKKNKNLKLNAFVTYKSINKIGASSGSELKTTNTITAASLSIDASSGAILNATVKTTDATIDISSGGDMKLTGSAVNTKIDASSGASFKGKEFDTENCTANASSGADIKIGVSKKLSASASSGASIKYKGEPVVEKKAKSSGGDISQQ